MMIVVLCEVLGDQEEFADLIGARGKLDLDGPEGPTFSPFKRGDWLTMEADKVTMKGDGRISISTKLGNTFTFRSPR